MDASPRDTTSESPACTGCAQRDRQIAALTSRVNQLESEIAALKARLEAASRASKRQAAPFSKGEPKPDPKTPGRKSGPDHGIHRHRQAPPRIDEYIDAPLPNCCPDPACRGSVTFKEVVKQYQTEIPRRPIYRQFNVHVGECDRCHRRVQGRHPLQTSDALGAAASQIGPDAQALVALLNKEAGMSHGKIQRFFEAAFDIQLSRGASCRVMLRVASRCEPAYDQIIDQLRQSPFVVPDETGWRIGGVSAWLHVMVAENVTAYLVHCRRGYEAAVELLGAEYDGFMTHDGWSPYDRFIHATHQACLGHLARRAHELEESAVGGAVHFPRRVQAVIRDALDVRDGRDAGEITAAQAAEQVPVLYQRMADLTRRPRDNPDNERFANHLWKLQESLFTFLEFEGVDATNYKAEQAIRPAIPNRKVWGGNRNNVGAKAQSIITSVIRTTCQRGMDTVAFISSIIKARFGRGPRIVPIVPNTS
jgi:transposase